MKRWHEITSSPPHNKPLSESCAVAASEKFWLATGQSNSADTVEDYLVWKPKFRSFCLAIRRYYVKVRRTAHAYSCNKVRIHITCDRSGWDSGWDTIGWLMEMPPWVRGPCDRGWEASCEKRALVKFICCKTTSKCYCILRFQIDLNCVLKSIWVHV